MILVKLNSKYKNFIDINGIRLLKKEDAEKIENFFIMYEQIELKIYDEETVIVKRGDISLEYINANLYNDLLDLKFDEFGYSNLIYDIVYLSSRYEIDDEKNDEIKEKLKENNIFS